jgi:hypothetical protein
VLRKPLDDVAFHDERQLFAHRRVRQSRSKNGGKRGVS